MASNGTTAIGRNAAGTAVPLPRSRACSAVAPGVYDDPDHSEQERRLRAIGPTSAGRYMLVAFTVREQHGRTLIRPISARYMHGKEIQHYERRKTSQADAAPED